MRIKAMATAATALLLLTACSTDEDKGPAAQNNPTPVATGLSEQQWNDYRATAERKLPTTAQPALWKGTIGSGADYASDTSFDEGDYVLDLVCVGEGEAFIALTLSAVAVTQSVPCSTAGIITTKDLKIDKPGSLKVSGGTATTEGRGKNVLVGRLTQQ